MPPVSSLSRLTTTSYAVLGLLNLGDWTAYELAKLMDRSVGWILPRAASVIYEEPKKLTRAGLVEAESVQRGQRAVTRYHLAPAGQAALQLWTSEAAHFPQLDAEVVVKVLFAEADARGALLGQIVEFRDEAKARLRQLYEQNDGYLVDNGPFPDRLPVIALTGRFVMDYLRFMVDWADWAEGELRDSPFDTTWALGVFRRISEDRCEER